MSLKLAGAEELRKNFTKTQAARISKLYEQWAAEVSDLAEKYASKNASSASLQGRQLKLLQKQIEETGKSLTSKISEEIKIEMNLVSRSVFEDYAEWMGKFGFSKSGLNAAFSHVPKDIVNSIASGRVYSGKWSLSKAIWGANGKNLKAINEVIAGGVAQDKPIYEIAKDLEVFINPKKKRKKWNLTDKDGRKIYPKAVDYDAQRLARTMIQHSYQQSVKVASEENPFIKKIRWNSNGSRVCDICKKRDGKIYDIDKVPLDHPNGMCVMEPVAMDDDDITDELAAWVRGNKQSKEIDEFAKKVGYVPRSNQNAPKTSRKKDIGKTNVDDSKASGDTRDLQLKKFDDQFEDAKKTNWDKINKSYDRQLKRHIDALKDIKAPMPGMSANETVSFAKADSDLKFFLKDYWGSMKFDPVNRWLRGERNEELNEWIDRISRNMKRDMGYTLEEGLSTSKRLIDETVLDKSVVVYRYIRETNDKLEEELSTVGNVFEDNAFVSTTFVDQGDGVKFVGSKPAYKMHILVHPGKGRGLPAQYLIDKLRESSNYEGIHVEDENEFTLNAGTKFKVIKKNGNEVWLEVI